MTADLYWLVLTALMTATLAFPYVVERILRIGLLPALGYCKESGTAGFEQAVEKPAVWAKRAHSAHRNAVEGFAVFAALILVAHIAGVGGANVVLAAKVYFFARLAHFIVYTAGIPVSRTLTFFVALSALFAIGYLILAGL